jgi:hypothetical protein
MIGERHPPAQDSRAFPFGHLMDDQYAARPITS